MLIGLKQRTKVIQENTEYQLRNYLFRKIRFWSWKNKSVLTVRKNQSWRGRLKLLGQFSSVAHACPTLYNPRESQHARPPCPSPTPGVYSNSGPWSRWCHPTISPSVIPFCPQSLPASGSFPMSQLFTSGGQSTGVSASASILPMSTQDRSLGWTGWISLQSKGLSRVFSNITVQKHQFFGAQLSL